MLNRLKKNNQGFTIIEVLIVLAIAGLILLIVFLAVPALQRNNRNTQRKSDISKLLAAVSEFSNNNNGRLANACSGTSPVTVNNSAPGSSGNETQLGYYNLGCAAGAATVNGHVGILVAYANTGPYNASTNDYVTLVPAARCNGASTAGGSARQWAAVYLIETGANTYAGQCQES